MPVYVTPGVYYEPVDADRGAIAGVRTDVAGLIGVAYRGPVGRPVRISTWRQFESAFGGLHRDAFLGDAVQGYFANGGDACHVLRVAAPASTAERAPGAVQPADGLSSLVMPTAGFVTGAVVTVTELEDQVSVQRTIVALDGAALRLTWDAPLPTAFWRDQLTLVEASLGRRTWSAQGPLPPDGSWMTVRSLAGLQVGEVVTVRQPRRLRRANRRLAGIDAGGARLLWEDRLTPFFDPGGRLSFAAGAAPASLEVADEMGEPALLVEAASEGDWGSQILVVLVPGVGAVTRTRPATGALDRDSTAVGSVAGFQRGDLVRIYQGTSIPQQAWAVVTDVDAARQRLVWYPSEASRALAWSAPFPAGLDLGQPVTVERIDFALGVRYGGRLLEVHSALSLVPEHARYAPLVVNQASALVRARPAWEAPPVDPGRLSLISTTAWLQGGRDGLAALTPRDFVAGLPALGAIEEVAILAAPDAFLRPGPVQVTQPAPLPPPSPCPPCTPPLPEAAAPPVPPAPVEAAPHFSPEDAFTVQQALVDQCERLRFRVALLDAPPSEDRWAEGADPVRAWRRRFDTTFAGLYFPWLLVKGLVDARLVPPSGHVAGLCARFDLADGVHHPPANGELALAQSLGYPVDDALQGVLNPEGINAIRAFPGRGIRVFGARTLSSDPLWRYLNVRRLLSMIEKSILLGTQWAIFEPDNRELRELLRLGIEGLLEILWQRGALVGRRPEEAFYVKCDDATNPPAAAAEGQLLAEVGVAPASPAEFVVLRVGRVADHVEIVENDLLGIAAQRIA